MVSGIGVDLENIGRFRRVSADFLRLVFTKKEILYCKSKKNPEESFAGRFCAKEAVIKALNRRYSMKDIEIINDPKGNPEVFIRDKRKSNIKCTISHSEEYAVAFVLVE